MQLYEHQKRIITDDLKKCGLWIGTGCGKTLVCLLLARGNTLVVTTKTVRDDCVWEKNAVKFDIQVPLTVISKEDFRRDAEKLPRFDTIIFDEAHTILGVSPMTVWKKREKVIKTSQLFEAARSFLARTSPERLYLATATPTRSPMAVWGAATLLGKTWNFYDFRHDFYFPIEVNRREIWTVRKSKEAKEELGKKVRELGYTGRLQDFFDVPAETVKTEYFELTDAQKKAALQVREDYPDPLVRAGKIDQVENGTLAGDDYSKPQTFPCRKIDRLIELADEFPKMLVFAKYTLQVEAIRDALVAEGKKVLLLTGATKDRGAVITEANTSEEVVVVAQAQVSAGYELTDFPVCVFASMSGSLTDFIQGKGRVLRANALGKKLYVHLVTKGGVDEARYKAMEDKKDFDLAAHVMASDRYAL